VNCSIGLLILAVGIYSPAATEDTQVPDPDPIVQKALENYRTRGDHRKNYAYLEEVGTQWSTRRPDFNTYENIFVNGKPYRRHIRFNGQAIRPEDEQTEREKMFEGSWRYRGGFRVSSKGLEKADDAGIYGQPHLVVELPPLHGKLSVAITFVSRLLADPQLADLKDAIT
jgi:hypothetical protein